VVSVSEDFKCYVTFCKNNFKVGYFYLELNTIAIGGLVTEQLAKSDKFCYLLLNYNNNYLLM